MFAIVPPFGDDGDDPLSIGALLWQEPAGIAGLAAAAPVLALRTRAAGAADASGRSAHRGAVGARWRFDVCGSGPVIARLRVGRVAPPSACAEDQAPGHQADPDDRA